MEIWKDIPGYEGLYQVSNIGNVKSLRFNKIKSMKKFLDKYGYHFVRLIKDKKGKWHKVHRLVAMAFLENYSEELQVNHKNEVKTDNSVENLEMCTNYYNATYGSRKLLHTKPIIQATLDGTPIKEWVSAKEVERELGFKSTCIYDCCRGYLKDSHSGKVYPVHQAYGFKWYYKSNLTDL